MTRQPNHEASSTTDNLLQRFVTGDRRAQNEFIRCWEASIYRIAFRVVGQAADAEEVRQNVLLKMLERPDLLPKAEQLGAWIRRCVINASLTLIRKKRRRRNDALDGTETAEPDSDIDTPQALQRALNSLQANDRALLSLRFDESLTVRQISQVLQVPRSTVQFRLQRAMNQLKSILQHEVPQ